MKARTLEMAQTAVADVGALVERAALNLQTVANAPYLQVAPRLADTTVALAAARMRLDAAERLALKLATEAAEEDAER